MGAYIYKTINDKKSKKGEIVLNRRLALEAVGFYLTARDTFNVYLENVKREERNCGQEAGTPRESTEDDMRIVPAITNMAFSCELCLKSLLPEGTRGHRLKELFLLLSHEQQTEIGNCLKGEFRLSDSQFDDKLDLIDNSFVEWRYIIEARNRITGEYSFMKRMSEEILNMYGIDVY